MKSFQCNSTVRNYICIKKKKFFINTHKNNPLIVLPNNILSCWQKEKSWEQHESLQCISHLAVHVHPLRCTCTPTEHSACKCMSSHLQCIGTHYVVQMYSPCKHKYLQCMGPHTMQCTHTHPAL